MDILTATRISAYTLNAMTKQLGLGNLAHFFDGDNLGLWSVLLPEVRALRNGRLCASLEISDSLSSVEPSFDVYCTVPDVRGLVRSQHLAEFRPDQYGLHNNTAMNWMGQKEDDLIVEWNVPFSVIRTGPARPTTRTQTTIRAKQASIKTSI